MIFGMEQVVRVVNPNHGHSCALQVEPGALRGCLTFKIPLYFHLFTLLSISSHLSRGSLCFVELICSGVLFLFRSASARSYLRFLFLPPSFPHPPFFHPTIMADYDNDGGRYAGECYNRRFILHF